MHFDQLLLAARQVHVVYFDQLLGAAHYIWNLHAIKIISKFFNNNEVFNIIYLKTLGNNIKNYKVTPIKDKLLTMHKPNSHCKIMNL